MNPLFVSERLEVDFKTLKYGYSASPFSGVYALS